MTFEDPDSRLVGVCLYSIHYGVSKNNSGNHWLLGRQWIDEGFSKNIRNALLIVQIHAPFLARAKLCIFWEKSFECISPGF